MWFHQEILPSINEGASFSRQQSGDIVETAKVIAIVPDTLGIPHVRFSLRIARQSQVTVEQRTLALDWFASVYPHQVHS